MAGRLQGTVALVTGASSGIGEATALALAAEGAAVAVVARRRDRLDALAARIRGEGGTALALEADVTREQRAVEAVERTVAALGRLDTLVANAGVMLLGPVLDASTDEWRRMVETNVLGVFYCAHAGLPHLLRAAETGPRRVADLVNISSVVGRISVAGNAVYGATKHAVGAFSEALRREVTRKHVRVSLVEPGYVVTELRSHNTPEIQAQIAADVGQIEQLQPADIADVIRYLVTRPRHIAVNEVLLRPTEQ